MTVFISAIAFILLITGLILIHEFGHFFVARWAGVDVEEFGFGLPPRAFELFRWKGTIFSLNWIPFGGFVRLKGESGAEGDAAHARGSFANAGILKRSLILIAGVVMNFLLAAFIFFFGFAFSGWVPTYLTLDAMEQAVDRGEISMQLAVVIDDVLSGGTAMEAGIPSGSILRAIDDVPVRRPEDVQQAQAGKAFVTYTYVSTVDDTSVTVRVAVENGKTGVYLRTVPLEVVALDRSLPEALYLSMRETAVVTKQTVLGIIHLFSSLAQRGIVPEGVTGIVGIAQLTYTSVQGGIGVYFRLVALLSLSLAILNILPFPALDGGRLLFVLSELFFRPGKRRVELVTNTIGFAVLLILILLVTLYDIVRLF